MQTQSAGIIATSLASINAINERITRLQEEAKLERQKALEPFLAELAASGEVSLIVVRGYTPGFNDGEPCTHGADVYINISDIVHEGIADSIGLDLPENLEDEILYEKRWNSETRNYDIDEGILKRNREVCAAIGHVYDKPSAEIVGAINALIFETAEEENETDYYVAYVLKDGKFEMTSGDYECGY